jgi:hypothetical protein
MVPLTMGVECKQHLVLSAGTVSCRLQQSPVIGLGW